MNYERLQFTANGSAAWDLKKFAEKRIQELDDRAEYYGITLEETGSLILWFKPKSYKPFCMKVLESHYAEPVPTLE